MERINTFNNRNIYSNTINHTDFTNITMNNNIRTYSTDSNNLIEILQSATEDSLSNSIDKDQHNLDSDFDINQSSFSNDYSSLNDLQHGYISMYKNSKNKRAGTAPTKPKNELEEFKYSNKYEFLEKLYSLTSGLIIKTNGKFDVDSEEGNDVFKLFLERLEIFILEMKIKTQKREYRLNFTQAYKHLYKDGELSYLTEIFDSAQEGKKFIKKVYLVYGLILRNTISLKKF